MKKLFSLLNLFFFLQISFSQNVDHWETVVFAEDIWKYQVGNSEPSSFWRQTGFNDANWLEGQGGIGYGDGDDNTIISNTNSLYLRMDFSLADTSKFLSALLHADYDDGFVAYINDVEIARANINGVYPPFFANTIVGHEAELYQGGTPDGFFLDKQKLTECLRNGTNTLAIQVHNAFSNSSDMSSLFFFTVGVTDNSFTYSTPPSWFEEPFSSSNLPIVKINTMGVFIPDEPKIEAEMGIIDNGNGNRNYLTDAFNGYDGKIAIETRGASSTGFAKKNYGFETQDANGDNNNVPLLGMPEENDWILHGPYSDKSLIRNVLAYHIGNKTGRWTPRTRYCELIINDEYLGIYILTEKIKRDNNRVDIATLTPDDNEGDELTGGYIFQIDREEIGNGWWSPFSYNPFFVFHHPNGSNLTLAQEIYIINYVTEFETVLDGNNFNDPNDGYSKYIDVNSFVDYILATEVTREVDAYRLSTFMHKDKDSNGGKLNLGPLWDYNLAFGNADYCIAWETDSWAYDDDIACNTSQVFWIDRLMEDYDFRIRMKCRWDELREGALQTDSILQFIDAQAMILEEAQERNFNKWEVLGEYVWPNYFVGNTYAEEIDYLKTWITERLDWMDANISETCPTIGTEDFENKMKLSTSPNPFSTSVDFFLEKNANNSFLEINIYDVFGKLIFTTKDFSDSFVWKGKDENGNDVKSGMYYYILTDGEQIYSNGKLIKI